VGTPRNRDECHALFLRHVTTTIAQHSRYTPVEDAILACTKRTKIHTHRHAHASQLNSRGVSAGVCNEENAPPSHVISMLVREPLTMRPGTVGGGVGDGCTTMPTGPSPSTCSSRRGRTDSDARGPWKSSVSEPLATR
jgi:hypothetical protein